MVGAALLMFSCLLDGATRRLHDPIRQPVSTLALGAKEWVQTITFVVNE